MPNFARERKIKDALAGAGVRESDLDLFITEYRNGDFDDADVSKAEWLDAQRAKPHRSSASKCDSSVSRERFRSKVF
jgi:hypothetical protein